MGGRECLCFAGAFALAALLGCAGAPHESGEPAAAPRPAPPAAPAEPGVDPRVERQVTKELLRDVEEYHRLLREKSVEKASAYVVPERRAAYQDVLWEFVARYTLESAHVLSHQLYPQPDGFLAKLKVQRTLFEKGSVVPQRTEVWMTWRRQGDNWILIPQQQN